MELKVYYDTLDHDWIVVAIDRWVGNEVSGYYHPGVRYRREAKRGLLTDRDWVWCLFKKKPQNTKADVGYQISTIPYSRSGNSFEQKSFFDLYFETEQSKRHVYDAFIEFHQAVFPELLEDDK